MKPDAASLLEEEQRLKRLKLVVDLTSAILRQTDLNLSEAQRLVADARNRALELFPDKGETFDLIYGPRFRRILVEKYHLL
jgi:hypothetical protein